MVLMQLQELEQFAKQAGLFPLREPQRKALEKLCAGKNLLLIWPTGSGKSLCYQLPALALPGLTIVISPLIALMDDQTAKARGLGWPVTCVHSGIGREDRLKRLRQVGEGKIKLLYVTPERFRQEEFLALLRTVTVSLLAVDEAHCISQWGHDFRPDYSKLRHIRGLMGNPQVLALTATATPEVQTDILRQLDMEPGAEILWEGVERPNLYLAAKEFAGEDEKLERLVEWLREIEGAKIIYFTLISTLERISEWLQAKKFPHRTYHGDLEDRHRRQNQSAFVNGESFLMLATPAFGLGVDKPDIRGVAHFEIPGSIEAYFQEVGRAGRDGKPSRCELLYVQNDLETQMGFIESLTPEPDYVRATYRLLNQWKGRLKTLRLDDMREQLSFKNKRDYRLETALSYLDRLGVIRFPHRRLDQLEFLRELEDADVSDQEWKERKQQLQKKLMALVQWFRSDVCRKVVIYAYFGWPDQEPCKFCDVCEENGDA